MKIALPVDDKTMETTVCMSFGRAPYFLLYDPEESNSVFLDNTAAASQGGAGILAAQSLVDAGVTVLLTPRCGENAAEVIAAAKIPMHRTKGESIMENITAFLAGELAVLGETHPGMHGHGQG